MNDCLNEFPELASRWRDGWEVVGCEIREDVECERRGVQGGSSIYRITEEGSPKTR